MGRRPLTRLEVPLISFLIRSLIGRVFSLGLIVLIVGVAGWYFFIREDNAVQKEAAQVSDAVRQAAEATATSPASGQATVPAAAAAGASNIGTTRYRIVEGQSLAWYLAPEKLARLPTSSVAKGETSEVTGEFHLTADGLDPSKPTTFTVGVDKLASDAPQRDQRMRNTLEVTKFPTATFVATKLTGMPREFTSTDAIMQLAGKLTVHGVEKEVTWELKVKKDGAILSALATVQLKYVDFGMEKPFVAGFVTVEDDITIQVQLFVTPS